MADVEPEAFERKLVYLFVRETDTGPRTGTVDSSQWRHQFAHF